MNFQYYEKIPGTEKKKKLLKYSEPSAKMVSLIKLEENL